MDYIPRTQYASTYYVQSLFCPNKSKTQIVADACWWQNIKALCNTKATQVQVEAAHWHLFTRWESWMIMDVCGGDGKWTWTRKRPFRWRVSLCWTHQQGFWLLVDVVNKVTWIGRIGIRRKHAHTYIATANLPTWSYLYVCLYIHRSQLPQKNTRIRESLRQVGGN